MINGREEVSPGVFDPEKEGKCLLSCVF